MSKISILRSEISGEFRLWADQPEEITGGMLVLRPYHGEMTNFAEAHNVPDPESKKRNPT